MSMSVKDSLQTAMAVAACKAARAILRGLNRGGTSLPGKLAMWFRSDILAITSEGVETILVTGTNGKTTTAGMLAHAMEEAGRAPLCNRSGANLLPGITAEFASAADLQGRPLRGQPLMGRPQRDWPLKRQPLKRQPMQGQPMQGQSLRGQSLQGQLVQGQPMHGQLLKRQSLQGQLVQGQPVQGQPVQGQPLQGRSIREQKRPDHPADSCTGLYAVIECDEGALHHVAPLLRPRVIVVTNLFRDQLDRYGEVMHTLEAVREGIRLVPDAVLCLNADDSLTASLALDVPNPVIWFGLEETAAGEKPTSLSAAENALQAGQGTEQGKQDASFAEKNLLQERNGTEQEKQDTLKPEEKGKTDSPERISDARYCIRCGTEYTYRYHTYAHLGDFRCPSCGYARPVPDVAVTSIDGIDTGGSRVHIRIPGRESSCRENVPQKEAAQEISVRIALPAVYNIYNAAASLAAYVAAGLPVQEILEGLAHVQSSFGRMEHFTIRGVSIQMILVKNPAGCNQALDYLCALKDPCTVVLCLNDLDADGHDISWIWDVDYEKLWGCANIRRILVWGRRAEDMQLRLKYAGLQESSIQRFPEKDLKKLLDEIYRSQEPVFILPNYTTMLPLRDALRKAAGKASFWKG